MLMTLRRAALGLAAAISLAASAVPALADYPEKPIRIIVPTEVGGAIDSVARIIQKSWLESGRMPAGVVVVNMPGAGGAVGTREIMSADPDGYTIGVWHDGLITSKAMGVTKFDHTAFTILGNTGYDTGGIGAMPDKSGIGSFQDLVAKAKANPNTVTVATNVGLPVHFFPMMIAEQAGIELRFVQTGGGSARLNAVLGGHTDVGMLSILEFQANAPTGLKPLLILSDKRDPLFPDVPIPSDFGIDVVGKNSRIWLAPKGIPQERIEFLANALREAMAQPVVKARFVAAGMDPVFVEPPLVLEALDKMLNQVMPLVEKVRAKN